LHSPAQPWSLLADHGDRRSEKPDREHQGQLSEPSTRTPVETGAWITLATLAFAAVFGFIAVLDTDSVAAAFGTGFGVALLVFLTGATIACALACLARRRLELLGLGSIVAAGAALDMLVLAIWLDIDSDAYGKVVGIAYVWSLLALVILGLALVFLAALWFGTLAADRLERGRQITR
jgi:hypothetical protein